jgi:hypothetical protein
LGLLAAEAIKRDFIGLKHCSLPALYTNLSASFLPLNLPHLSSNFILVVFLFFYFLLFFNVTKFMLLFFLFLSSRRPYCYVFGSIA